MPPTIKRTPSAELSADESYIETLDTLAECYELLVNRNPSWLNSLNSNQLATLRHCCRKAKELKGFLAAMR